MVNMGILSRNNRKEYLLGDVDSGDVREKVPDEPRPGARSRRQKEYTSAPIKKGVLHAIDEDRWIVTETGTGKEYPMAHRREAPGKEGQTIAFTLYPHPKMKHTMIAKVEKSSFPDDKTWKEITTQFMKDSNLPEDFSASIHAFVDKKEAPSEKDFKGRVDYRKTHVLCIDPEGARDHDDAVSVEKLANGGFKLGVHIADVSHYVPEGSELDQEALSRSYTQYLPWCAVPMLPERLSGDLCSLHEGVDRLAFTCMMELNSKAEVEKYEFHKSVVNVTCSISYGRAVEMFKEGDVYVAALAEVTRLLKINRSKNGILELGSTEFGCQFDEKGEPVAIVPRPVDESNSWIEECMLIANQCCAKELKLRGLQGIYRIHEAPDTRDIMELNYLMPDLFKDSPVTLRDIGKPRRGDTNLDPTIFGLYQHLVKRAAGDETILNRILRSMQKAHYDSNSFGHFALNWQDYAHFTSPIRRYADLWCHRELSRTPKTIKAERANSVIEVCDLISSNEIKNQKLERISIMVCATWLLRERLGEEFEATVNGVEQWGIYVTVKDPWPKVWCGSAILRGMISISLTRTRSGVR
jgi:ribonuclease R